ncbi:HD-GYP domain-containing protein [Paludibacterium yongneupense]|uniref:HD-GYP domain-containing protein n=1 Tax=Paludibacterium yongneupense TaxID=400061 RepID=UPI00068408C6|nr:HD-GYP domain-containing protein [Paludibacterium yongneupense]
MISYHYLDSLLNSHRVSIHRTVLVRLIPAWLLLSLMFGGAAYWLELRQMDQYVTTLSTQAINDVQQASAADLLTQPERLTARLDLLLERTGFVGVLFFDTGRRLRVERWRVADPALRAATEDLRAASPPLARRVHRALHLGGRIYVISQLPLSDAHGRLYGYFEGIYPVAAQTAGAMSTRIRDILLGVLLVCTLSSLALYPIIVGLNRDTLRLTHTLLSSNVELMRVLGNAIAKRDSDTDSHNYRVTLYCVALAEALHRPANDIIALMAGAFLHDVGKIGISDRILLKQGPLEAEEFAIMKTHVGIGLEIIAEVKWLDIARDVVGNHHERYDGSGYPQGLAGEQIPFNARLFAIVDVFDALTSRRPYKEPYSLERSLEMMRAQDGRHFDPDILHCFETRAAGWYARYHEAGKNDLKRWLALALAKYFRHRTAQQAQPD